MAIRLRKDTNGDWVALCAAETAPLEGDIYLDDGQRYALTLKYLRDWKGSGLLKDEADTEDEDEEQSEGSRR